MNNILLSLLGVITLVGIIGLSYADHGDEEPPILQTSDQFSTITLSTSEFDLSAQPGILYAYQDDTISKELEILQFTEDESGNYVSSSESIKLSNVDKVNSIATGQANIYVLSNGKTIFRDDGFSWFADDKIPDIAVRNDGLIEYIYTVDYGLSGQLRKFSIDSNNNVVIEASKFVFKNTIIPTSIAVGDSGLVYISHSDETIDVYEDLGTSFNFVETIDFDHALVDIAEEDGSLFIIDTDAQFYKYSFNGTAWDVNWHISIPIQDGVDLESITTNPGNVFIVNELDGISRYSFPIETPDNPFTLEVLPPLYSDVNNLVNHKRTIPIQFELIDDNGNLVLDQTAVLTTNQFTCETTDGITVSDTTETSSDDLVFSLIDGKYKLNFSTKSLNPDSCYSLNAEINGIEEHIADILVR